MSLELKLNNTQKKIIMKQKHKHRCNNFLCDHKKMSSESFMSASVEI